MSRDLSWFLSHPCIIFIILFTYLSMLQGKGMMQTYWLVGKATETMTEERNNSLAKELKTEMEKYTKENASKSVKVHMTFYHLPETR